MNEKRSFNWRVIDQIETLINESGLTRAEVIVRSGMRRNTFFVKMRGETALTTDEIAKLAGALGYDPLLVLQRAAGVTPLRAVEPNVGGLDDAEIASREAVEAAMRQPIAAKRGKRKADREPSAD